MFVSSANKTAPHKVQNLGRLLIYMKNNRGPKTEPCGTSQFTSSQEDLEFPICTNAYNF